MLEQLLFFVNRARGVTLKVVLGGGCNILAFFFSKLLPLPFLR